MDWNDLAHFLTLARTGTLRAAAKELHVAPTTVSRRIASLEATVGASLFVRSETGFAPTRVGRELAERGRDMETMMAMLARRVGPAPDAVEGDLRISATEVVTAEVLAPSVSDLLARHPGLRVTLRVDPRVVAFSRDETDIAVRMTRPEGARLVARRVASISLGLYATRAYLARAGRIAFENDRFLTYDDSYGPIPEVRWFESHRLSHAIALRTPSTRALLLATLSGAGIGLLPTFLAQSDLEPVEPPGPIPSRSVYLVTHEDLRKTPVVNVAWSHLVDVFGRLGERER